MPLITLLVRAGMLLGAFALTAPAALSPETSTKPVALQTPMLQSKPIVLGYYPSWVRTAPPEKIDYSLFTHIVHAFATVREDKTLRLPEADAARDLCRRAHAQNVKVLLALGGADSNDTLTAATADEAGAEKLTQALVEAVAQVGYDGIDVDWEFPENDTDQRRMEDLVRRLRAALKKRKPDSLLTMAVPALNWNGRRYATDALLPHVDFINVMTYDMHGPWSDHAGHNAPLLPTPDDTRDGAGNNVAASLEYWTKERNWPRERLLIGIPCYGRGFRASKLGEAAKGNHSRSYVSYSAVNALIGSEGWTRRWDDAAKVPVAQKPGGGEIVSYEDAESAGIKGEWARKEKVGGIFFWEITQDYDGKTHTIVAAARRALSGERR